MANKAETKSPFIIEFRENVQTGDKTIHINHVPPGRIIMGGYIEIPIDQLQTLIDALENADKILTLRKK